MANYQFKVEYSPGKFIKMFRIIDTSTYSFYDLVDDIKKHCPGFTSITAETIRIRFRDDEGDYINLTEEDKLNFEEMLQQATFLEERNMRRIQLRISELDSPCALKQSPADKKRKVKTKHGLVAVGLKPRSLKFTSRDAELANSKEDACPDDKSKVTKSDSSRGDASRDDDSTMSALERYVDNARTKVDLARAKLEQMQHERDETLERIESARAAAGDADVKTCGNCHLRLGHSQKKCTLPKCTDVFSCGLEKRHPGQVNRRRLDQESSKQQKLVSEAEEELKRRTLSFQTVQKSKTKQIENNLVENHKGDYTNGHGILDWNLLRKHTLLIENYCKKHMNGKIPGKQSIKNVLKKATQDYKESGCEKAINRSKKRKGNPAKNALHEHGINFPSASKVSSDSEPEESDDFIPEVDSKPSSDLSRCMPNTAQEEENQIELAIQASLQGKHRGFDPNYFHPNVVNPAAMPMPMFSWPNFDYYNPAHFLPSQLPPYYNQYYGGQASTVTSSSATSSQAKSTSDTATGSQAKSANSTADTSTGMTNVSSEVNLVPEISEEAAAMALMTLHRKN